MQKTVSKERIQFPRRLAIVAPRGEQIYQFVMVSDDVQGCYVKILDVLSKHYVNLSSTFSYSDIPSGTFVTGAFGDFKEADRTAEQVKSEVSKLPFVRSIEVEKVGDNLFDKSLFPILIAGDIRAAVLPVDALLERERYMLQKEAGSAESILETQRPVGANLAGTLRKFLPWTDSNRLLSATADALRSLGWGIFEFDLARRKEGRVKVNVRYPIFSEVIGMTESFSVIGIASGVLEGIYGTRFELKGSPSYSKETKEYKFELSTKPAPSPRATPTQTKSRR
jgi:hypothetical protein